MLIELKINGSVRQRSNGLIEFRNPVFGSVYGRTPEELQEKLKQKIRYEKAHIAKPAKKKKSPLLSEFYENNYLPYKQTKNLAESTIRGIKYNFKFIREQEGFNKPLTEYTSKDIEEFLLSIPQTRKRQIIQGLLNNMFTRALADSLISANPCAPLEKMEHDTDEGKALSFEEQKIFLKNCLQTRPSNLKKNVILRLYTSRELGGTKQEIYASAILISKNLSYISAEQRLMVPTGICLCFLWQKKFCAAQIPKENLSVYTALVFIKYLTRYWININFTTCAIHSEPYRSA